MVWLKSRISDWRNFLSLSNQERRLLAVSMLLLPILVVAHPLLGLKRVQWALNRLLPGRKSSRYAVCQGRRLARSVSRIVRIAANRGLCHATCLQQSVLLHRLLTQRGIVADLRIGVRKCDGIFQAHAWVECLGDILNESTDVNDRFAPFPRRDAPALPGEL
jgi:hypothetical protein